MPVPISAPAREYGEAEGDSRDKGRYPNSVRYFANILKEREGICMRILEGLEHCRVSEVFNVSMRCEIVI